MPSEPIDDPLFRQRYAFAREGDLLRIDIWTEPGGGVLAQHVHPRLEERYLVAKGEVTFRIDGKPQRLHAGERVVVAPGVRHSFENTGYGTAHLLVEADPALRLGESIEDGARLAHSHQFTRAGRPRTRRALVEVAALARRYPETVVLASPPPAVQRLLFGLLARFASQPPVPA